MKSKITRGLFTLIQSTISIGMLLWIISCQQLGLEKEKDNSSTMAIAVLAASSSSASAASAIIPVRLLQVMEHAQNCLPPLQLFVKHHLFRDLVVLRDRWENV